MLSEILVDEGATVDVGTLLAVIEPSDAPLVSPPATSTPSAAAPTTLEPAVSGAVDPAARDQSEKSSPAVRRLLEEHKLRREDVPASGPGGRLTRDDVLAYVASGRPGSSAAPYSPVLRRLLDDHDLDPDALHGTGPQGRLTRHDVESAIANRSVPAAPIEDEVIPFTKARRLTAEHMVRSKATSAHTLMVKEVDFEHVEQQRRRYGPAFKEREGFTLTYLPFVALAVLAALKEFPRLNASVGADELIVHHRLNLGIAVDLDGDGLVVPVIRDADQYDLFAIARKVRELADGARTKKLTVDDMNGGTFTITNPGPFGTLLTGAVINQPQIAILSTDGVTRRPVVVTSPLGDESIAIHSVGLLALTFDHRAIDGATAARFLAHVAATLNDVDFVGAT